MAAETSGMAVSNAAEAYQLFEPRIFLAKEEDVHMKARWTEPTWPSA
jgi:hypothetical protein